MHSCQGMIVLGVLVNKPTFFVPLFFQYYKIKKKDGLPIENRVQIWQDVSPHLSNMNAIPKIYQIFLQNNTYP